MNRDGLDRKVSPWVIVTDKPAWASSIVHAYRIWMETDGRQFWQKHEWIYKDGGINQEDWITTPFTKFPSHYIEPGQEEYPVVFS